MYSIYISWSGFFPHSVMILWFRNVPQLCKFFFFSCLKFHHCCKDKFVCHERKQLFLCGLPSDWLTNILFCFKITTTCQTGIVSKVTILLAIPCIYVHTHLHANMGGEFLMQLKIWKHVVSVLTYSDCTWKKTGHQYLSVCP